MNRLPCSLVCLILLLPFACFAQARDALVVDELSCRGNEATSCDFILGHVYLAPGDRVDEEEISNAQLRLASLPSFRSVDIYLERGQQRDHVRVVIEVSEADPYAREWLAGSSARYDSLSQLLTGRVTHQNLFGRGKLLDVSALAFIPVDGKIRSEYVARIQYVDPHWLNSKRTFLIAGISAGRSDFETLAAERLKVASSAVDMQVGRRIFDFSYVSLLYRYAGWIDAEHTIEHVDGSIELRRGTFDQHVLIASYGWNSEDDPYFPTRGSRASLSWVWSNLFDELNTDGGFRKTWTTDSGTSLSVQVADTPRTEYRQTIDEHFEWMVGVARPLRTSSEMRRGRWYVEAGYTPQGHNLRGERQKEYGLKLGVRMETRAFGIVDLYVIGSGLHTDRGEQ
jgi:outer membrane protein assembly factor BamA